MFNHAKHLFKHTVHRYHPGANYTACGIYLTGLLKLDESAWTHGTYATLKQCKKCWSK